VTISQVPSLDRCAVWARQERAGTHDRKRSVLRFLSLIYGALSLSLPLSRPLLITQHQVPRARQGMNFLPAPWSQFIRETGPDWGSDINKLDPERPSQRTKSSRDGASWLGGTRYKRSCHSTFVGPSVRGERGHLDLDLCRQISFLTPRKAGIVNLCSRPPTTVRPSSSKLCEADQPPREAEFLISFWSAPPAPEREKEREAPRYTRSANFHAKDPSTVVD
jgi:hypothetical protein